MFTQRTISVISLQSIIKYQHQHQHNRVPVCKRINPLMYLLVNVLSSLQSHIHVHSNKVKQQKMEYRLGHGLD